MVRVEGGMVINRPVEDVFDFVADKRNEPRYMATRVSITDSLGRFTHYWRLVGAFVRLIDRMTVRSSPAS